jgi:DNA-binding response OmpR family regulator
MSENQMTDAIPHARARRHALEQEAKELHAIFAHSRWRLDTVGSLTDALNFLRAETVPVLICDINLPDGSWLDVLRGLAHLNDPPRPIAVVASPAASCLLGLDALNVGACDVVELGRFA